MGGVFLKQSESSSGWIVFLKVLVILLVLRIINEYTCSQKLDVKQFQKNINFLESIHAQDMLTTTLLS